MHRRDLSKALFATVAGSAAGILPFATKPEEAQSPAASHYDRTAAETAAGIKVVNPAHPPGAVDRYGINAKPGETDMSEAIQDAAKVSRQVTFLGSTYLVADVTIEHPVAFRGRGFDTVLLARTTQIGGTHYSRNIFTASAALDFVSFEDLTLDGGCDNANKGHPSEISLVKITNTAHVSFNKVKLTRYCGGWDGTGKPISASFWQAITIQNAARCEFLHCLFTNNHYEMVLVWNGPNSEAQVLVDGCTESNTGTPNSHTAFDVSGGHVTVTNCTFRNTGATSCVAIQVPKSARVTNNVFLDPQPGAAAQIDIGQDIFPYNSQVLIEGNHFRNANSAAISVGQGNNVIIRGNIIETPVNYGIKLTAGLTDFALFTKEYPEWPAPVPSGSKSLTIANNKISAVSNAATISKAIYLHTVTPAAGYWYEDLQITGNTVTAAEAPHDTYWAMELHDVRNAVIRDNRLQYTKNGIRFGTLAQNVHIEGNTFSAAAPRAESDIIWAGAYSSKDVDIRNNRFETLPVGPTPTINVFAGTVSGLSVIDNEGIHPTRPVESKDTTGYVVHQRAKVRVTQAPSTGDWGVNDVVKSVPASGGPQEYSCTAAGSFGTPLTCAATGTEGKSFFTCNDIGQLHVGLHFSVAGAGPAGQGLRCTCTYISGATFYVDQVIARSVSGASMTLVNPTFVSSANHV